LSGSHRKAPGSAGGYLQEQYHAFKKKFGRKPGPGDPVFFDPDANQPQFRSEAQRQQLVDSMYHTILVAGINPAYAYAFRKTGRLLTTENMKYLTPAELAEWNDAIAEYQLCNGSVQ
jgi:hypothetical protein